MAARRIAGIAALSALCLTAGFLLARGVNLDPELPPPTPKPTLVGTFSGFCEASALAPWKDGVVVGDNEDEGALHPFSWDLEAGSPISLPEPVEDIEALAALPQGLLVVGSQSENKNGKNKPLRERVLLLGAQPVRPNLSGCPACEAARGIPPKEGGLSIEGAVWWQGALWFGLRSPLVEGRAILLRMRGDPASSLEVDQQVLVDLGGYGVRDLTLRGEDLVLLAGPADAEKKSHRAYRLDRPDARPDPLPLVLPPDSEGLLPTPEGDWLVVMDGDGKPGAPCRAPATWKKIRTYSPPTSTDQRVPM